MAKKPSNKKAKKGQKKKLNKPPPRYAFVGKGAWRRFVAKRTTADWESNLISDGGSFYPGKEKGVDEDNLVKPSSPPEKGVDEKIDDECVVIKQPTPPPEKQVMRKCDLSVGTIENKVAFGYVINCQGESSKIHGREMSVGCLRVSVD
ncbi:hypothetical protein ACET3Z_013242 [Daucus carota]